MQRGSRAGRRASAAGSAADLHIPHGQTAFMDTSAAVTHFYLAIISFLLKTTNFLPLALVAMAETS